MSSVLRSLFVVSGIVTSLAARGTDEAAAQAPPHEKRIETETETAVEALFTKRVLPLLRRKCAGCHGDDPEDIEAALNVKSRQGLLAGGESGTPALVPGKPAESRMYIAVTWKDEDLQMPPKERNRLTAEEVELVRRWIAAGAPWPEAAPSSSSAAGSGKEGPAITIVTSGGLSPEWTTRKYQPGDVWAYQPIQRPAVPRRGIDGAGGGHPIDAFIEKRLGEKQLAPGPRADKLTLIRRATFDLTGLPPTPGEIDAFLASETPNAFEDIIDRLLRSPHYGEQMARQWLDVVRYADSSGFSNDFERPHAWRYRDYVIRSFNEDKPYDRFVTAQIAGDELDPEDPTMLVAVGFLRMGPWEHTGMSVAAVTRQHFLDDVTNAVGVTFLAQGLRCARCHDHKFDPIPTRDYYRLQAAFAPVQFADRRVAYQPWENIAALSAGKARTERLLKEAQDFLASLREKHRAAVEALLEERGVASLRDLPALERPKQWFGLTRLELSLQKIYQKRTHQLSRELKRSRAFAFSVYDGPPNGYKSNRVIHELPEPEKRRGKVPDVRILKGGALGAPGEKVSPGVLSAVHRSNDATSRVAWNTIPESMRDRRLALAKWIASPGNTLTARVIANRIWQHHFASKGLVATPNNFGKMGRRPSHPQLLDWLATWFIEHGWSPKKLHRLIMTSAVYQRSSEHPEMETTLRVDPSNDLLAYAPSRRLAAEEIRDSMLAITGELNPERGGPGIFPEINWEVALQSRHVMGSVAPAYQPSPDRKQRHRRTIYAFRRRTQADPFLEVFNRPGSDKSCERRDETTVTPQAFSLFNSQFAHQRALALAHRLETLADTPERHIDHAFRLVYGRPVTGAERQYCLAHLLAMTEHHRQHEPVVVPLPTIAKRKMVEELTGETVEWEEELDLMKDYQRDLMPWDVGPETRALAEVCLVLLNSNEFLYVR